MQLPIISDASSNVGQVRAGDNPNGDKRRGQYAVISLGCPKNLVDTEQMLGRLEEDGYRMISGTDGADFVVINTCGFIDSARDESFGAIDEMLDLKRQGKIGGVVVTGCLAERQRDQLLEARPEIDALIGVFGRDEIVAVADRLAGGIREQRTIFRPAPVRALPDTHRVAVTPRHFAYLKISEGCDRLCTFCAIPKMRGKHASKPIETIVAEAEQLARSGVREMVVVAQDTTYYGMDLYGKPRLTELLEKLDAIEGLDWIRMMYFYPMYIDDRLLDTIAAAKRIVPYIDIPLQHGSNQMLKRMARRVNRDGMNEILGRMREKIDRLVLRTTFITGFPGETDQDFDQLVDLVEEQRFEHLGVFTYSIEDGTPAIKLPARVPLSVAEERRDHLMAVQQPIAFAWNESRVGTTEEVLIDSELPEQPGIWIGRTYSDAPDIDGLVYVTSDPAQPLAAGQMVPCELVASQGYDLVGVPIAAAH
ncbi:Ribosomal protein S12 methylthiotransferase RimO [Roseimaritima multifibrata]|uniref:Ribosomal protein uS12 methylthiotransferase RimO n=1 Tax=Roseimaritima multifibrata TaxID=1930274 RepID=A0A517MJF8_9BACT|nr:30S ribosomal protein S12 methylthiotransferase RimO [Roseimaritima multifibrata]QDS95035.1 Ribosomal protein S12 methylthiotransferase RimO [Roseimaritima multifibrata]